MKRKRRRIRPLEERFWEKVKKTASCWLWIGSTNGAGYGHLGLGRAGQGTVAAHRLSWKIHHGKLPPVGIGVLHRCDVSRCVRPSHLFCGNALVNMRDAAAKSRLPKGERHWNSKLTEECVRVIRCLLDTKKFSQTSIATRFGVTQPTISDIARGQGWRQKR